MVLCVTLYVLVVLLGGGSAIGLFLARRGRPVHTATRCRRCGHELGEPLPPACPKCGALFSAPENVASHVRQPRPQLAHSATIGLIVSLGILLPTAILVHTGSGPAYVTMYVLILVLAAGSGTALFVGIRGRRTGSVPHCARCGYNLTGLPASVCPECGAPFSDASVARGTWQRRPRLIRVAVAGLVVSLGLMLPATVATQRGFNWWRIAPTSVLVQVAKGGDGGLAWSAANEIVGRARSGKLRSSAAESIAKAVFVDGTQSRRRGLVGDALFDALGYLHLNGQLSETWAKPFMEHLATATLEIDGPVLVGHRTRATCDIHRMAPPSVARFMSATWGAIGWDGLDFDGEPASIGDALAVPPPETAGKHFLHAQITYTVSTRKQNVELTIPVHVHQDAESWSAAAADAVAKLVTLSHLAYEPDAEWVSEPPVVCTATVRPSFTQSVPVVFYVQFDAGWLASDPIRITSHPTSNCAKMFFGPQGAALGVTMELYLPIAEPVHASTNVVVVPVAASAIPSAADHIPQQGVIFRDIPIVRERVRLFLYGRIRGEAIELPEAIREQIRTSRGQQRE